MKRMLPVLKSWTLWYAIVLLCMPLLLLAQTPATQPAEPPAPPAAPPPPQLPSTPLDGATIRLPDGRVIDLADLQAGNVDGVVMLRQAQIGADGHRNMIITEDDRVITINETDDEIVVTVKEGDGEPVEYRAANAEELERDHPEAFEMYERFAQVEAQIGPPHPAAGVIGQRVRVRVGAPVQAGMAPQGHPPHMLHIETLGIRCSLAMDPFVRSQLGEGLIVTQVGPESFGKELGLAQWDMIKSINGKPVRTADEADEAVHAADPVVIEILRGGQSVKLEEK